MSDKVGIKRKFKNTPKPWSSALRLDPRSEPNHGFFVHSGLQPLHCANDLIGDRFLNPVLEVRCEAYA